MSKILDTKTITTYVPKIIELRNGFVINGQYYLKDNMQPVPFNTICLPDANFTQSGNSMMHMDRSVKIHDYTYHTNIPEYSLIAYDSQNEKNTFVLARAHTYSYLLKFVEDNNRCVLEKSIIIVAGTAYIDALAIEDSEDKIKVYTGGGGYPSYCYYYKKSDLSAIKNHYITSNTGGSNSYPYDIVSLVDENLVFKSGYGFMEYSYYVEELNRVIGYSIADPAQSSSNANRHRIVMHNVLSKDEENITVMYPRTNASGVSFIKEVDICTFNKNTNTWSKKTITVDNGDFGETYYANAGTWTTDFWIRNVNGKTYMFLYLRNLYAYTSSKMIIFEYNKAVDENQDEVENITLIKIQDFPTGQSGRIIHFKDEDKLKFYGSNKSAASYNSTMSSIYCYELDESTLDFVKTFDVNGSMKEYAFDKDRNLYILWEDMSVTRHNERTVANFNAKFESGLYEYEGEDIDTKLIISTTNLQGEYLSREVKLDIKGNAIFKGTGVKSITVTTSNTDEIEVPVTITGAGALNIFPKVKA